MGFAIAKGETLALNVWSLEVVIVKGRFRVRYPTGALDELRVVFTTGATGAGQVAQFDGHAKSDGEIISGQMAYEGANPARYPYVKVYITPGVIGSQDAGDTKQTVCSGYIRPEMGVALGEFYQVGPSGGRGAIRSIAGTNPAAGAEVSETVPGNAIWSLMSLQVTIVGGAADFFPAFQIDDGTTSVWEGPVITVAATATEIMCLAEHGALVDGSTSNFPLPRDLYLPEGYRIRTRNISADDNYGAPRLLVEEWVVPI